MQIPFHRPYFDSDEITEVTEAIESGWVTMGYKTLDFEKSFGDYTGLSNPIAVNSCTAALHLALRMLDLSPGDEVIIPAMTFAATAEAVCYEGAMPVFADVDRDTHLIDVESFEKKITSSTKAVIPVHYGGQTCDMDSIVDIARKNNLTVIEDAAHALPSYYKGRIAGSPGDIGCFSFYATKTISTGEGGMVVTGNDEWAERIRRLRLHGISRDAWKRYSSEGTWQYDVTEVGFKYNTTDINSALGLAQLRKIDFMNQRREEIAGKYNAAFCESDFFHPYMVLPHNSSSWHLYPLRLNTDALDITRNSFIDELSERGISTGVHYIPLYRFSYYSRFAESVDLYKNTEWIFERQLSLPVYPSMSDEETAYVINAVMDIAEKNKR